MQRGYKKTIRFPLNIVREVKELNLIFLMHVVSSYNWHDAMQINDPNDCFNTFSDVLYKLFDEDFPVKLRNKTSVGVRKPYITRKISTLIRKKHRLQRLLSNHPLRYNSEY